MRILLAALNAQKGDLDANLARHLAVLEQARVQGCDVAVFPELPLTGSVGPGLYGRRTDERGWRDGHAWCCRQGWGRRPPRPPAGRAGGHGHPGRVDRGRGLPGLAALVSPAGEVARLRWWSPEALRSSAVVTTPRDLPELLEGIARGDLPDADEDLGV